MKAAAASTGPLELVSGAFEKRGNFTRAQATTGT